MQTNFSIKLNFTYLSKELKLCVQGLLLRQKEVFYGFTRLFSLLQRRFRIWRQNIWDLLEIFRSPSIYTKNMSLVSYKRRWNRLQLV